jgi:hypothetical protein
MTSAQATQLQHCNDFARGHCDYWAGQAAQGGTYQVVGWLVARASDGTAFNTNSPPALPVPGVTS